eukprot:g6828.t1
MPLNPTAEDGGGEDKPWTFWKMQTETLESSEAKALPVHPAAQAAQEKGKKRRGVKRYAGIGAQASCVDQAGERAGRSRAAEKIHDCWEM